MKKIILFALSVALYTTVSAQPMVNLDSYAAGQLATKDLNGTARYVGMGGALEALGADLSTMSTNPAGIGMFRRSHASVSFGMNIQGEGKNFQNGTKTNASFDQVGVVISTRMGATSYLNIGFNTMLGAPSGYDFNLWPSFDVGFGVKGEWMPYGKKNVWSVGMGVYWRHYRSSKDYYWWKVNDVLKQVKYPEKLEHTSTSLNVISLGIPIMYTHYFDNKHKWGLTLGAIVNWNSAYARRYYEVDDEDYDVSTKKIGQRPITIDGIAIVRIPSCPDIYCKYCPMEFFKDGRGPKMHQLSFGFYW